MTQELAHYGSAGVVGFARGLNDTPKIAALLLSAGVLGIHVGMIVVALVMAIGGLLNSRKVANTMSKRITRMNSDHGFAANIATGTLVILASQFGLPVSTTHVSVGSLFGVGLITKKTNANVVRDIVFSWVLTLPMAAILSGGAYWLLNG
jgi:PiT family inorganic phosphate transporter